MTQPWYQKNPDDISLEEANSILNDSEARVCFPNQFKELLECIKKRVVEEKERAKEQNGLAWIQPSFEQTLKLNCWWCGIDYVVDFDANRIGKTTDKVINLALWTLPNDPEWILFKYHIDHKGRRFQTLRRPPISAIQKIRDFLRENEFQPDPRLPFDHPDNILIFNQVVNFINTNLKSFPLHAKKRTYWVGAPDKDYNKDIIMPEFKKWIPSHVIDSISIYDGKMKLKFQDKKDRICEVQIIFKSYDSEDTKFSGAAVDGIMMTEGIPKDIFNELRQRYKYPAFGSWDYTPYEPRNTAGKSALAHKAFKDPSILPLTPFVFSGFGIEDAPDYILPDEKRKTLIKNWKDDPQGDARIRGIFYSSSPVILKNYQPNVHALQISFEELRARYAPRPLILFRGVDPGWGHVTACAWMALAPDNTRYIYKFYSESQRSIGERCDDIIRASGNIRIPHPKNPNLWIEKIEDTKNKVQITYIDYHSFKTDENTKRPFAHYYTENGLIVRPSITYGPAERATKLNDMLQLAPHLPHPITKQPPGSRLFFLCREPGVAEALQKMENLFWQTFEKGEKRGLTKDTVQDYDDDELDATCYVACPQLSYSSFFSQNNAGQEGQNRLLFGSNTFSLK